MELADRSLFIRNCQPESIEGLEDCVIHLTQIHAHDALGQSDVDSDESQINRIFDEGLRRSLHDFGINLMTQASCPPKYRRRYHRTDQSRRKAT